MKSEMIPFNKEYCLNLLKMSYIVSAWSVNDLIFRKDFFW